MELSDNITALIEQMNSHRKKAQEAMNAANDTEAKLLEAFEKEYGLGGLVRCKKNGAVGEIWFVPKNPSHGTRPAYEAEFHALTKKGEVSQRASLAWGYLLSSNYEVFFKGLLETFEPVEGENE